jgi:hypothetical protein
VLEIEAIPVIDEVGHDVDHAHGLGQPDENNSRTFDLERYTK